MKDRHILLAGSVLGGLGVACGAFGAHWLEGAVGQWGLEPAEQAKRLDTWEVAVRYQIYHALALLTVGLLARRKQNHYHGWAAGLFVAGIFIFCGSLYALVLSGVKILGAIVPIGGTSFIVGWVLLAIAAWKSQD